MGGMDDGDHSEITRGSFERQTGLFSGPEAVFAVRRAPAWVDALDPAMLVLDVACGAGHVAEELAPHVHQVVGLDLTPALLQLGAQRLRQSGVRNVLLQEGDATRLPFIDGSFDLVVCRSALHHVPDPARAVAEMARVCRPGGRVIVSDMVAPGDDVRAAFDSLHRRLDPSHAGCLLVDELADVVRSEVGPLERCETPEPFTIAVQHVLTDASDSDAVLGALRDELTGGPATGFDPVIEDGQVQVSFRSATVHARRVAGERARHDALT